MLCERHNVAHCTGKGMFILSFAACIFLCELLSINLLNIKKHMSSFQETRNRNVLCQRSQQCHASHQKLYARVIPRCGTAILLFNCKRFQSSQSIWSRIGVRQELMRHWLVTRRVSIRTLDCLLTAVINRLDLEKDLEESSYAVERFSVDAAVPCSI